MYSVSHLYIIYLLFGFILLGHRGEEFDESLHLKLFMSVLFTFPEVHVWFTVNVWLIYIKLTGLLYVWIKPYYSSGSYRWRIYARSRFILMAMLYLSQNQVALWQYLPKQSGIPLSYFCSIFITVSSGWGEVDPLTLRRLMSYIYIYIYIYIYRAPILDVSRSHTTTQHSR